MDINEQLTDGAVLKEVGARLARRRVELSLTQAALAEAAGVSKPTVERLEAGASVQLTNFIRILRALDLLHALEVAVPPDRPGPMSLLRTEGKGRRRAPRSTLDSASEPWRWGDET